MNIASKSKQYRIVLDDGRWTWAWGEREAPSHVSLYSMSISLRRALRRRCERMKERMENISGSIHRTNQIIKLLKQCLNTEILSRRKKFSIPLSIDRRIVVNDVLVRGIPCLWYAYRSQVISHRGQLCVCVCMCVRCKHFRLCLSRLIRIDTDRITFSPSAWLSMWGTQTWCKTWFK